MPESWTEKVTTDDLRFYYPADSMLMVTYDEMDSSITNESKRKDYMNGLYSGMEKHEELAKAEITVAGTKAYRYDVNFKIAGSDRKGSIVIFDYNDGIVSFLIGTKPESDNDYRRDFENILNSVKFTMGSNTNTETEDENLDATLKTVKDHFGTDVVLKGNKTEKWISFQVDSSVMKYLSDYEQSSGVRYTWEEIKVGYKDISKDLTASSPGYTLRMINPLNSEKILLSISDGEVMYDYFADLIAENTDDEPEDEPTMGETNAVNKAEQYLSIMAFSQKGLIKQLDYDGFSKEEANYAVKNIEVDWNDQASIKGESYLKIMSFSKNGLIKQLEFDGFTTKQAEYGAKENGY